MLYHNVILFFLYSHFTWNFHNPPHLTGEIFIIKIPTILPCTQLIKVIMRRLHLNNVKFNA